MKNKGRRQIAGHGSFAGIANCKSDNVILTRSIRQMGSRTGKVSMTSHVVGDRGKSKKFLKRAWSKRVRGYFKNQKEI